MDSPAIGIDLGTTTSCVAVWSPSNQSATVIVNDMGHRTTPSVVAFTRNGERLVGEVAVRQGIRNAENTVFDAKRMIGKRFKDLEDDRRLWPFKVEKQSGSKTACVLVKFGAEECKFTPEEISAAVLAYMKKTAEDFIGKPISRAVVTVPAYFNDSQRQATKDAAAIAGLQVERIINEPTAASLAFGFHQIDGLKDTGTEEGVHLLIFDLGGGTLDVTVLCVDDGVFEVLSTAGDTHLGGEDFDGLMVAHFVHQFEREHGIDAADLSKRALRKLKQKCQECKHMLSQALRATVDVEALHDDIDFEGAMTRAEFEEICEPLLVRCLDVVRRALSDAGKAVEEIDEIVLVGGSTRIVAVQELLQNMFGRTPSRRVNPDEAVAIGAAIQAANLDLAPERKKGTRLDGLTLMDVAPMSLGMELASGKLSVLIPRNTTVPFSHTKSYANNEDNQTFCVVEVYEGEHKRARKNRLLGRFQVNGLPPRPRGQLQIDVTFALDANSILQVSARVKDGDTFIEETVTIDQQKGLLSSATVERKQREEAERQARLRAEAERRRAFDELENYLMRAKRSVKRSGLLAEDVQQRLNAAVDECARWVVANRKEGTAEAAVAQRQRTVAFLQQHNYFV